MDPILPKLTELVDSLTLIKTEIKLATLGARAGAFGAIAYTIEQIEEDWEEKV
ncbi:MAG: hypothetical protein LBP80_12235 [Treponema sp.]|jgi:hypothetical protein|nr:hypothetical protein [Treponema sp.]